MTLYRDNCALVPPQYPRREAQEAENHRAMSALFELIENAIATAENYVMYTEGRLLPLAERGTDLVNAECELNERYRHEAPCGWTEERVMEHCDQHVTRDEIAEIIAKPPIDITGVQSILRTFQDAPTQLPRGRFLLMRENLTALKPHQPPDINRDLSDIIGALYEIQYVDLMAELREELSELDVERDKAQEKLDEAISAHERAVAGGDVVEVERAHRQLIAARYEFVAVAAKRMQRILGDDIVAQEMGFAAQMDALQQDAEKAVEHFADALRSRRNDIRDDIRNCDKKRIEEDGNHQKCLDAYRTSEKESDAELRRIVKKKQSLVDELLQKARELRSLMERQKSVVEAHVRAKRAEELRVTTYNEFVDMEEQQKRRLLQCLEYFDRLESLVPNLQAYIDDMITRMPRKGLREAMEKLNDIEAGDFMDAYSKFVSCCSDLTVKKLHRLDTLERQARLMEHNRNSSMESLDPNMNNYRVELEDLIEQMKGVSGVINALNATQDAGEQLFQSVEEGVRAKYERAAEPFVHPLQECGLRSVEERGRFVDRSMRYVEDEERKVQEKKNVLRRMRQAVEEDEAATELALRSSPAAQEY
ncbi:putative paraflagellar rod component [Trypanosoma theileri]|uniref:Putative paraflagellar rod component n=1 Tax=Trypanosoma theileri TaxID=67003 RepID=A0A1X0NI51_9TRYP|nr:putative paraflagellar rod component [Trypanosoma theileri]ORC84327.1 putative paraflagellar rod component [Trypanosoma theileri]